jgi:4-diphosphocytidyl-2-C-methyl-D-erythritol kinase
MFVRRYATTVEVLTPAKLNLFLEVLARRADGYHEIETLMTTIGVFDSLLFTATDDREIRLQCRWPVGSTARGREIVDADGERTREPIFGEIPGEEQNLVWRAADLIRTAAKIERGAKIGLIKRVPAAAGLGGGSSDAAAALVAANLAWNLHWPTEKLAELAARIGSDVPFFLTSLTNSGGAAVCRGRGEQIDVVRARRLPAVVVRPPVGVGTAEVYRACRPAVEPARVETIENAIANGNVSAVGKSLLNRLQPAAADVTSWIQHLRDCFENESFTGHQMSGSGSSYFGLCRSARCARRIASRLRARRLGAVFATTTAAASSQN